MNNKPVAWMETYKGEPNNLDWDKNNLYCEGEFHNVVPLYTHPVKELTDKITEQEKFIKAILKKGGCDGNICQKYNANPVKELTDEEIMNIFNNWTNSKQEHNLPANNQNYFYQEIHDFARAILRKAQEK